MFVYADPVGRNFLSDAAVAAAFRARMEGVYEAFARRVNSGFTWLEAFDELTTGAPVFPPAVAWLAFPKTATGTDKEIDKDRLGQQDEYVEWRAEVAQGKVTRLTFTTEFPEYYEAFAAVGLDALTAAVRDAIPGANPTAKELFGPGVNPAALSAVGRSLTFRDHLPDNPWNNGRKGILCLMQPFNTLGALFNLVATCGVPLATGTPQNTCSLVANTGACGPNRDSDPNVCAAAQTAVRGGLGFSLRDPAGVRVLTLEGDWEVDGTAIDVNDPAGNQGVWVVSRNGRRGTLTPVPGLTLDGNPVVTGTQVSRKLRVGADLVAAPNAALPSWAQIGAESGSRGPG